MANGIQAAAVTAAALVLGGAAVPAAATTTLNLTLNQLMSSGQQYSGQFDISSFLAQQSDGKTYRLDAATVTAYGYSNFQQSSGYTAYGNATVTGYYSVLYQYGYTYSYRCGLFATCYTYVPASYGQGIYYSQTDQDYRVDGNQESMSVSTASGATGTGTDSTTQQNVGSYSYTALGGNRSQATGQYSLTFGHDVQIYDSGYYGDILTQVSLASSDLSMANINRLVQFSVTDNAGSIALQQASLSMTLSEVVPAPEPATWAMMLTGFGAVGVALRRKRREVSKSAA